MRVSRLPKRCIAICNWSGVTVRALATAGAVGGASEPEFTACGGAVLRPNFLEIGPFNNE